MRADGAHGYTVLHITVVCTWHRAAMVVIVVRLAGKICFQTFASGMNVKENDNNDRTVEGISGKACASEKSHPQHLTAVRTWHQVTRPLRWPQQRVLKTMSELTGSQ